VEITAMRVFILILSVEAVKRIISYYRDGMMVFWKQKTINELNWYDWERSFGVLVEDFMICYTCNKDV